ncbi:MAG: EAL domain-containing protein [Gammaproteobacteria bacterium]|nr:EAL domain-containing protein [Gammaproteobacteria bacterium]MBI5616820.1 EAL domain-containing protein [Gammaproteobacteria bacterium]
MTPIATESDTGIAFRALTELAPDFVGLLDADGRIRYVSAAVARVLGWTPSEVVGRPFTELLLPDDRAAGAAYFAQVLASDAVVNATVRFRHRDGGMRIVEALARNFLTEPTLGGVLVSTRDVSSHAAAERALRDALAEAADLYDQAPCGYHSVDASGVFVRINDTELRWLGYTREELVGRRSVRELLTPAAQQIFDRWFPVLLAGGEVHDVELDLVRRDGTLLPVLQSATAHRDAEGRFIMSRSTLYDITERRLADRALRRVNRALRVLSAVNSELVHGLEEKQLLEAVCRVIVEYGGYRMVWVGFAQQDRRRSVIPVAQAGFEQGYLETANITWADDERGRGPTGTTIRTGEPQVNQNFLVDPRMGPWRAEAAKRGYQASVALPLFDAERCFGALTLYAAEPDAFDAEEERLLSELAGDLAFGIVTLRARAEHRRTEAMVKRLAYFDTLTALPNRTQLFQFLDAAIAGIRGQAATFGLVTLNVDGFRDIQTGIGVRQADDVLKKLAIRLQEVLGPGEQLALLGGDVFAVILRGYDEARGTEFAARVQRCLAAPIQQAGIPLSVQMNMGVAVAPDHGTDPAALILRSGIAARQAKLAGVSYAIYGGSTDAENPRHLALVSELRAAIETGQLVLHYQPKIDIETKRVAGMEALVRWPHPTRGLVPPGQFIGIAEQTGLIKPLTYRVLELAVAEARRAREAGFTAPVAVNVSARNFRDPEFLTRVRALIRDADILPGQLELEITETAIMEDPAITRGILTELDREGVPVSIDDFGTGYSSLAYVAMLPISTLKIDRSFVVGMLETPRTHAVVTAMISLARALGIRTVAEGVETRAQLDALTLLGCDEIQGYYFSPPLPIDALREWAAAFAQ